jgi:hypothetical protein
MMFTAALLSEERFLEAMASAETKDRSINYAKLKSNPSIVLLYNPSTGDGKFSTKLMARAELQNGYYQAYPHVDYAETLAQNNANLQKYGWPDYEGI